MAPSVLALVLAVGVLPLMVLTATGARRRGLPIAPAVLAGICFPVTWAVWYVLDEDPYDRSGFRAARRRRRTAASGPG